MAEAHFEELYRIETTRLVGWDYSQPGWYFITICCENKKHYFDDIEVKKIAESCWLEITQHFPVAYLGEWVVMPNHLHGVVCINPERYRAATNNDPNNKVETHYNASLRGKLNWDWCRPLTSKLENGNQNSDFYTLIAYKSHQYLPEIMRMFKGAVTRQCNEQNLNMIWQPRYFDHIIRSEKALFYIEDYIRRNPENWSKDINNEGSTAT